MKTENAKQNIKSAASDFGRMGGLATSKKRGKKYMSKIGKQGAKARWGNKK